MTTRFETGERIWVYTFGGFSIERVVVEDFGETLLLSRPEEFEAAKSDGRKPLAVAYPKEFVAVSSDGIVGLRIRPIKQ